MNVPEPARTGLKIIAAPLNPQMFFVSPLQAIADIAGSVGFHAGLPEFGSNSLKG